MDLEIYPVTGASALAWLRGEIPDAGLIPGREVIYWKRLLDIRQYPAGISAAVEMFEAGARGMIIRSCNPIVSRNLVKRGCVPIVQEIVENDQGVVPGTRFIVPPDVLLAWVEKVSVRTADDESKRL